MQIRDVLTSDPAAIYLQASYSLPEPPITDPATVDLDKAVELLAKREAKLRAQGKDPRAKKKTTRKSATKKPAARKKAASRKTT